MIRLHQLAKELGVTQKALVEGCVAAGIPKKLLNHHMARIPPELVQRIRSLFNGYGDQALGTPPDNLGFDLATLLDDPHIPYEEKARIFAAIKFHLEEAAKEAGLSVKFPGEIDQAGVDNQARITDIAKRAEPRMAAPPAKREKPTKSKGADKSAKGSSRRGTQAVLPSFGAEASRGKGVRITRKKNADGSIEETYEEIPAIKAKLVADLGKLKDLAELVIEKGSDAVKGIYDHVVGVGVKVIDGIGNTVVRVGKALREKEPKEPVGKQ